MTERVEVFISHDVRINVVVSDEFRLIKIENDTTGEDITMPRHVFDMIAEWVERKK